MPRQPLPGIEFDAAAFGRRVERAIAEAGKTQKRVAAEAGISEETVSKIVNGVQVPGLDTLVRLAIAARTTVGFLVTGDTTDQLTPEDYGQLRLHRAWIDQKEPKLDARREPNAEIVWQAEKRRFRSIADSTTPWYFSDERVEIILRAKGESMIEAGIMPGDYLFAIPGNKAAIEGKIVACRLGSDLFAKRMLLRDDQRILVSANGRYNDIPIGRKDRLDVIGIVIARAGMTT